MLSQRLFVEGLVLQKRKTRIVPAAEFRETSRLLDPAAANDAKADDEQKLLGISVQFDPYSANPTEDYERLTAAVREIDVVGILSREIVFVSDRVLPEFWLPDSAATVVLSALRDGDFSPAGFEPTLGELCLDPLPTAGVVGVAFGHAPDCVEVLGQKYDRANIKRVSRFTFADDVSKDGSGVFRIEYWAALVGDQREEECPARNVCSSPVWHVCKDTDGVAMIRA